MNFFNFNNFNIELGVNIDHVATLRNARGTIYPDPLKAAILAEQSGADFITLHLREDRRHINDEDVKRIHSNIFTRMNLECSLKEEMINFACELLPKDVCLVPENRSEITTEGGLNIIKYFERVKYVVKKLQQKNIRVSLFIDPEINQINAADEAGAKVIEIHTGCYAEANMEEQSSEISRIHRAVNYGLKKGLKVNGGHGLNYDNAQNIAEIDGISELNIGHSIISEALFCGLDVAIKKMKKILIKARNKKK